jgi:hypothetical protein
LRPTSPRLIVFSIPDCDWSGLIYKMPAFFKLKHTDFFAQMREKPTIIARPFVFRKQSMT